MTTRTEVDRYSQPAPPGLVSALGDAVPAKAPPEPALTQEHLLYFAILLDLPVELKDGHLTVNGITINQLTIAGLLKEQPSKPVSEQACDALLPSQTRRLASPLIEQTTTCLQNTLNGHCTQSEAIAFLNTTFIVNITAIIHTMGFSDPAAIDLADVKAKLGLSSSRHTELPNIIVGFFRSSATVKSPHAWQLFAAIFKLATTQSYHYRHNTFPEILAASPKLPTLSLVPHALSALEDPTLEDPTNESLLNRFLQSCITLIKDLLTLFQPAIKTYTPTFTPNLKTPTVEDRASRALQSPSRNGLLYALKDATAAAYRAQQEKDHAQFLIYYSLAKACQYDLSARSKTQLPDSNHLSEQLAQGKQDAEAALRAAVEAEKDAKLKAATSRTNLTYYDTKRTMDKLLLDPQVPRFTTPKERESIKIMAQYGLDHSAILPTFPKPNR